MHDTGSLIPRQTNPRVRRVAEGAEGARAGRAGVDMPTGRRPLRGHVIATDDGAGVVNAVAEHIRAEFLRRLGTEDLLRPVNA